MDARRDRRGTLRQVTFPWTRIGNAKHGGLPSTTLADFTIDGSSLTVSVNSAKRAKAVRAQITKRVRAGAIFLRDEVQSIDEAMAADTGAREIPNERAARRRDEELQATSEVQAMIAKMNADHYATWPDVPLPALKGKTPRAAMRTADGCERVEALIVDFTAAGKTLEIRMKWPIGAVFSCDRLDIATCKAFRAKNDLAGPPRIDDPAASRASGGRRFAKA